LKSKDIHIAIPLFESETIEFKKSFQTEVIETLVAFANSKGGSVYIGVQDDGTLSGIELSSETVVHWINEVKNKTSPSLIPEGETHEINGKTIVILKLQEYPIKPVAFRGKDYKRVKNSNHLLSTTEVVNMHLQTFNTSWDYHLSHQFGLEDISFDKVQQVIDTINGELKLNITDDPLTFLLKHDLVRDGAITNAAYLLFTKKDTLFTTIELGRFQTDIIIKDSARSKSDVLTQVDEVLRFV
jgi:ATP-dependent DNA helicase RecG